MTRVIGIDPGLGRTGMAVVDGRVGALRLVYATCLETVPQTEGAVRLASLMALIEDALTEYQPTIASVEQLFFANNRTTAMRVSEARGVILCACAQAGVPIAEYTPMQVKHAVAGYGGAKKAQVRHMVSRLLDVSQMPGPDDVADACAVAVCHHHRAALAAATVRGSRVTSGLATAVARAQAVSDAR